LDWVAGASYDLILLDVMLPGLTGFEVCRILRERGNTTPVLMLTARDEVDDRVTGLDAGADDYLAKPFAFKELLARIRALTRRTLSQAAPNTVLKFADLELDTVSHQAKRGQRQIELTVKEYALLEHFMRHPRQILSRTLIRESIWGYDYYGASNVVDVYVGHLRRKLETNGEPALIHTVRGVGYKIDDPE
jgi:DNA-binding response OmpR family regulator